MTVVLTWVVIGLSSEEEGWRGRVDWGLNWVQLIQQLDANLCSPPLPFTFKFGQGSFCLFGEYLAFVGCLHSPSARHKQRLVLLDRIMVLCRGNRSFLRCVEEMNQSHQWTKSKRKNPMSNSPSSYWGMKSALLNLLNLDVRWQRHSATSDSANIYLANILNNWDVRGGCRPPIILRC